MKKVILFITGLVCILGAARPNPGDSVDFYVNQFYLILSRDPEVKTGIVRYVGENFALVSLKEKIVVNDIARRNWSSFAYPDSFAYFVATGLSDSMSDYCFYSLNGGFYWKQTTQGINSLGDDVEIYKILTNPNPPQTAGNWAVFYFATNKGIYSQRQNVPPSNNFGKIAFIDKPVYSVVFDPDSVGPIPVDTLEILFAATDSGVYKLRVSQLAVQQKDSLAEMIHLGNLTEKMNAVAVQPVTKNVYAGGDSLWVWDGSSWSSISGVYNINEIKIFNSDTIVVLTADGLFYSLDGGSNWNSALSGYNLYDIDYGFGYFWVASYGNGVLRAQNLGGTWEEMNQGFSYLSAFGSLNCRVVYFDNLENILFVANDQGIWKFDTTQVKWKNFSRNIKNFLADEEVETVKYVMETYTGENLFNRMKTVLGVKDEELWDMNADSVIDIVLYPLEASTDSSLNKVKPLYGYFDDYDLDPSNPDASLKEIFVLNFNYDPSVFYVDTATGVLDSLLLAKYLSYLYSLYSCWSLEHEESKIVRVGFSMLALHLAGFNIFTGDQNMGIKPGRDFSASIVRIGKPLFDFTANWLRSPVARDFDRERMAYWFLYIRERLISAFNNDTSRADSVIFKAMLRDKNHDGQELFEYYLPQNTGLSFDETFGAWAVANLLDDPSLGGGLYGYNAVDSIFKYSSPNTYRALIPDSAGSSNVILPQSAMYFARSDTLSQVYKFDLQDDFGSDMYGFRIYRITFDSVPSVTKMTFDTTVEYIVVGNDTIQIFKKALNRMVDSLPAGDYGYVLVNSSLAEGYFAYSVEKGAPHWLNKYILQNPVVTSAIDFHVIGGKDTIFNALDALFGDANASVDPTVIFRPLDKNLPSTSAGLSLVEAGDTFAIYTGTVSLNADIKGDILVYSYAQDIVGNTTIVFYDTVSVRDVTGAGLYSFLGGNVTLEIPENSGFSGMVFASSLPENYVANNNAILVYSVGHSNITFSKPVKVTLYSEKFRGKDDIAIYRVEEGIPVKCETYKEGEATLYTYTTSLGVFAVMEGKPNVLPAKFDVRLSKNMLPVNSLLKFSLSLPSKSTLNLKIYDIMGRNIKEIKMKDLNPGIHQFNLPLKNTLTQGVYFMNFMIQSRDNKFSRKFKLIVF